MLSATALFEAVRQIGAEGIVSKRAGSPYRGGTGRDWLKTKVSEEGAFVITGYIERDALAIAELRDGVLQPAGLVKFGLAGKGLWQRLDPPRIGPSARSGIVPVRPELVAGVRFFGRYRTGWIVTACCYRLVRVDHFSAQFHVVPVDIFSCIMRRVLGGLAGRRGVGCKMGRVAKARQPGGQHARVSHDHWSRLGHGARVYPRVDRATRCGDGDRHRA